MAHVIIIRKHTNGNFTYAGYWVDLLCLGVKDTYYEFNVFPDDLKDWLYDRREENEMLQFEYSLAHNIIFAGHDLAAEYHISQHPDFVSTTCYLLEKDDEKIPLIEVHTGDENGLPHLIVGSDNRQLVALDRLKEYAGEGRYNFTILEDAPYTEDGRDCIFWSKGNGNPLLTVCLKQEFV